MMTINEEGKALQIKLMKVNLEPLVNRILCILLQ